MDLVVTTLQSHHMIVVENPLSEQAPRWLRNLWRHHHLYHLAKDVSLCQGLRDMLDAKENDVPSSFISFSLLDSAHQGMLKSETLMRELFENILISRVLSLLICRPPSLTQLLWYVYWRPYLRLIFHRAREWHSKKNRVYGCGLRLCFE